MSTNGDVPTATVPPPRVAARLNRAAHRRSASSSRRNSISSLHSSVSNRSGYGRSQSMHIEQQLRRATILEDRKAKIAERNAHAELVRMRAQQAKAAPRISKAREERAQAAQQARERHLAQVAANGAEQVKRAKRIAEEAREKKAAETLKLREDMEEKHADAEKRRLQIQSLLQRKSRSLSLPVVEERKATIKTWKPKSQVLAAQVIQQAWRNARRRKVMAAFAGLSLDMESIQKQTFEASTSLVAELSVLNATTDMLKLCDLLNPNDEAIEREASVRIFLSAYLILGHPQDVLSKTGELEEDLIGKAKMLLMQFQRVLSKPPVGKTFDPSSELMISLSEAYNDFLGAFKSWKTRDASFIIEGAIAQFVELDTIWQSVKNDTRGGVADDYKEGIRNSQAIILVRLKRILGSDRAFKMVNDAVKARRRSKAKKRPTGDVKPRTAAAGTGEASGTMDSAMVGAPATHMSTAATKDQSALITTFLNGSTSPVPENRIVIHELAINREFRIDVNPLNEQRQAFSRVFFNAMRVDVANGMGDGWILAVAKMIRERLLKLVAPGKSFYTMISEFLDATTIEQQLQAGNFSYEKFFAFMNSILPKLCAPVRDDLVKALANDTTSDFIERVAQVTHVIDVLSLDHTNYLLSVNAPEFIRHAPSYEQQCFEKDFASGNLSKTTRWWRQSRMRAVADLARRPPSPSATAAPSSTIAKLPSHSRIYTTGLIDLFFTLAPLSPHDVPETLMLDMHRIVSARADILRMVTISSILLTAKNLLKRDVRSQWKAQAQRMWDVASAGTSPSPSPSAPSSPSASPVAISSPPSSPAASSSSSSTTVLPIATSTAFTEPAPYLSILDSTSTGTAMPPAVRLTLSGTVETVLANARAAPVLQHAVMKVILKKIRDHALARLLASSSEEKVRSASTATESLGAAGLGEFVPRISSLVDEMGRVRQVDWDAHGRWIDRVAANVESEEARASI